MIVQRTDADDQLYPAGRHVPQTSGAPSQGLPAWIAADPYQSLDNTDVVLWHTFGLNHFPAPEDYPIMPAEPISVFLRPRGFFKKNPALDVPPVRVRTAGDALREVEGKEGS